MKTIATSDLDTVTGGFSPLDRSNYMTGKMYGNFAKLSTEGQQRNGMKWLQLGREVHGVPHPVVPLL